jgi:flagellin-like hook-associated protein FlgL
MELMVNAKTKDQRDAIAGELDELKDDLKALSKHT